MRRQLIAAVLCALLLPGCITGRQWDTLKSHAVEVTLAGLGGAIAVVVGGSLGVAVFVLGGGTAAFAGELAKPDPSAEAYVIQDQPAQPDGTPRPPLVHHYDQDGKLVSSTPATEDAGGVLRLPKHLEGTGGKESENWAQRAWGEVRLFVFAAVALLVAGYVARTPALKAPVLAILRGLWTSLVWLAGFALRGARKGVELLVARLKRKTTDTPKDRRPPGG